MEKYVKEGFRAILSFKNSQYPAPIENLLKDEILEALLLFNDPKMYETFEYKPELTR
jgi:hypothetical protein